MTTTFHIRANLNNEVAFVPTRAGARLWNEDECRPWASPGAEVKTQLWVFCQAFGNHLFNGCEQFVEANTIRVAGDGESDG